jgi:hypothetical protein
VTDTPSEGSNSQSWKEVLRQQNPEEILRELGYDENSVSFVKELKENGKRRNLSSVGEDVIKTDLIQRFTNSPEALNAISYRYSKQFGVQPTNEDLTNYIMDEYKAKYGLDYLGEIKDLERPRSGSGTSDSDKLSYRQQIVGGVLQLDPASISKMQAQLPSGSKVESLLSRKIEGVSKGGYPLYKVRVTIPGNDKNDPISEVIDLKTGEPAIRFNQLLNEYSGETVSYSKFGIEGAKPRGEQFEPEKPKPNKGSKMSSEDTAALNWANANPKDPRAKAIKDKLKADKKI